MATAAASGDDDEWVRHAYRDPDLVAAVLLSFRLWCPEADERPSTSAPPSVCALEWGIRRKRSRLQIPRIFPLTLEEEEEEEERKISAATAAAEAEEKNRKEKKRRASPQSPLEGYSSASASGGEEGAKAGRSAGVSIAGLEERRNEEVAVAETNTREPTVSCFIRWPPSKKMTKVELQAVQTSLLEEKAKLVKEMEIWRRALEQLREENGKLKLKMPEYYTTNTPKCRCGRLAKIITSWTDDNPGRRFATCSLYENGGGCGFWTWIDNEMYSRSTQIIPRLLRRLNKLEADVKSAENTMKELEIENCKLLFELDKKK